MSSELFRVVIVLFPLRFFVYFPRTFVFSLKLLNTINIPFKSFDKNNHPYDLSEAKIKPYETMYTGSF